MPELVVAGARVVIEAWDREPRPDAWIAVSGGRIEAIGRGPAPAAELQLDAAGGLVMPGAVCAHHHLFQGASRGVVARGGLLDWLAIHYRAWARLTEQHVEDAAVSSLALLALGGCTTVAAFEYLHPEDADFVSPVVRAAERVGLRLMYVRGSAPRLEGTLAERLADEGVDTGRLIEPEDRALSATAEVLSRPQSERLRWACGPTTPVLDDDGEFHRALSGLADGYGASIHTHFHPLSGTASPGESAVDAARRLGLVCRGNWFAHGSRLTTADVAELGQAGVGVVHAPSCSILLGYPIPPLDAWCAASDRVTVAVDGGASNDRGSMLLEAQLAWQVQRAVHGATGGAPDAATILGLVTHGAARTIGWPGLGRLTIGAPADLAVIDLQSLELTGVPRALGPDPATGLLRTYAGGRVRHLLVGERLVVHEGELTGINETSVAAAASRAADELYGRDGESARPT